MIPLPATDLGRVWPDDPIMSANYTPMPWSGTQWQGTRREQGGQPAARVENGAFHAAVRGPWTNNEGQKTCALILIAPQSGVYVVFGVASSKPWEGAARTFKLGLFKKDTQRAAPLKTLELGRDGAAEEFKIEVELTAGHEMVFLPLMPDWHNATTTTIQRLKVELRPEPAK